MSGAIFSQDEDPGYPAPQALHEGFKSRYIAPVNMPAGTRCWHIQLPDDPQVESALHEILGILRGAAVWDGVNAEATAALISNTLHEDCTMSKQLLTIVDYVNQGTSPNFTHLTDDNISGQRTLPPHWGYKVGDVFNMRYFFQISNTGGANANWFVTAGLGGNFSTFGVGMVSGESGNLVDIEVRAAVTGVRTESGTGRPLIDLRVLGQSLTRRANVDTQRTTWFDQEVSRYTDIALSFTLGSAWSGGAGGLTTLPKGGGVSLMRV